MARRRSGFQKKIDSVFWSLSNGSSVAQSAGSVGVQFASVGTAPTTLMRMRGRVLAYADGAQAPPSGPILLSMGIIKVPEGTGSTVLYDPAADGNAPWIWFDTIILGYEEMVTDAIDVPVATGQRLIVDNKAMRRIRPDEELQFVVTNTTIGTALTSNLAYQIRWLQGF